MEWSKININDLTDDLYSAYYSLLCPARREKVDNFKNTDDKKRTVAGELLARRLISKQYGIDEKEIRLLSCDGKPYIDNLSAFISIAHSGDYTVCAVNNAPIGIDIEKIRPINLGITKRFTEAEQEYIKNSDDFNLAFFDIWTSKEAYIKYSDKKILSYNEIDTLTLPQKTEKILFDDYIVKIIY